MSNIKKKKKRHPLRGLLVILIIAALAYGLYTSSVSPEDTEPTLSSELTATGSCEPFEIYFLDVGQGDSALIICDGKAMLIDGGASGQSSKIYSFLKSHGINHLNYIVASHADADHVGGLAGALNYAKADTALCTVTEHETKSFYNFVKYLNKQGVGITVPDAGDTFSLGSASFTVIGPKRGETYSDNTSLIIRLVYGETSFLFTGDAEYQDEQVAMKSGFPLESTVLKVGHHGSSSSSSYNFIDCVNPRYAVISVGGDNTYGHPTSRTLGQFEAGGIAVLRTDMQGDIHCTSDGTTVKFDVEKNPDADTYSYIGGYLN